MAFVTAYYVVHFVLVDRGGRSTRMTFRGTSAFTALSDTNKQAQVTNLRQNLELVTACKIRSFTLSQLTIQDAFTLPSSAQAELEAKAVVSAQLTGRPNRRGVLHIPGPVDALFKATSGVEADVVNTAQTNLGAILSKLDSTGQDMFTLSDGETLVASTARGYRVHRKSAKG